MVGFLPARSFAGTDHLTGSAVATNSAGAQLQLLDYHPWGTIRINNQSSTFNEKRKFAGHEYDTETGLSYMVARYYSPALGRFLSEDPVVLTLPADKLPILLTDPQQWNSYAYGRNNPLTYRDPDGNFVETVVDVAMGLYDVGSFAFWGVQTVGTYGAIGLTNIFGDKAGSRLSQQAEHAQSKLLNATINVGIDAVGTAIPGVPALGLRALKESSKGANAVQGVKTFIDHVDVKSFGKTIYSGPRNLKSVIQDIQSGKIKPTTFENSRKLLSPKQPGYYEKYDVDTPGWKGSNKGPERIIRGGGGETYYTPDHYKSFQKLND